MTTIHPPERTEAAEYYFTNMHLPEEAWTRRGSASGNPFTVRALAYIGAGHVAHHARILRERYLEARIT